MCLFITVYCYWYHRKMLCIDECFEEKVQWFLKVVFNQFTRYLSFKTTLLLSSEIFGLLAI